MESAAEESYCGDKPEWNRRERCDPVQGEIRSSYFSGYFVVPATRAPRAYLRPYCAKSDPTAHTAQQAMPLGHALYCFDRSSIQKAKVACIGGDCDIGQRIDNPIENSSRPQLESRLPFAAFRGRRRQPHSLVPICEHLFDDFGRVLEVWRP